MKKKICAFVLSCLLCMLCVPISNAATTHQIYVHDSIQEYELEAGENGSGEGWSYDGSTDTLTLNGFNGKYILFMNEFTENDLTIVLNGQNTITWDAASTPSPGELYAVISSYSGINIKGSGSLNVIGEISSTRNISIESGNLNVTDINANGDACVNAGALGDVIISGGTTTLFPAYDEAYSSYGDNGVFAKNFKMTGGQLVVKAKTAADYFNSIDARQNIIIDGGEIISDRNLYANHYDGGTILLGANMKAVGGETKETAVPLSIQKGKFVVPDDPYLDLLYLYIGSSIGGSASTNTGSVSQTNTILAVPTHSSVILDGSAINLDAYEIAGNNYFKIRDLASVLSGTNSQFEVIWDAKTRAIQLTPGMPYTLVGGELTPGTGQSQSATVSDAKVLLNGETLNMTAYEINGNTYFKLRDLGQTLGFGVDWDGAQNAVLIRS